MRGVVALALLLSLASSGCFVSEDDLDSAVSEASASGSGSADPKAQSGTTASGTGSAAGTSSTSAQAGSAANEAPTAGLNATLVSGKAPLNVTFTVSGSDADGDALSWTLQDGNTTLGNGTTLPANVTATFEAGNHTVVLRVSDGAANATANVTISVVAGGADPLAPAFTPIHHEYSTAYFCELCTDLDPTFCIGFQADVEGIDCGWTPLPPEAAGRTYSVAASGIVSAAAHAAFFATCVHDSAMIDTEIALSGTVPAGAGCLVAWDFDGTSPNIEFVIDVV